MNKIAILHVKTRLWTPKGYDQLDRQFKIDEVVPNHILTVPLDALGKSFVKIKLTKVEEDGSATPTTERTQDVSGTSTPEQEESNE